MEQSSKNINVINMEKNFFNHFDVITSQTLTKEESFEKRTYIKPYIFTETEMQLPQNNQKKSFFRSDITDGGNKLLQTPPMMIKTALLPKAPIKQKKEFINSELKPKKLTYKDEEFYKMDDGDSGVVFTSFSSLNVDDDSEKCNITKCNIFNCDRGLENISNIKEVTPDTNVINKPKIAKSKTRKAKLNNKISENNIPRTDEIIETCRNARKNIITKTTCIKKSTNYSKKKLDTCERKESEKNSPYTQETELNYNMPVLSQYNGSGQWQEKLQWLQPRRDIGMWIKCCRADCKKWRYTEDYHDPLDVPTNWYCEMNSDTKVASCTIPEVCKTPEIEADLIENKYNAGSIVWAKRNTYSWWPAMVDDCPFTFRYYKLEQDSIIPVMYHIIFFDEEELVHSWHKCENIKPFTTRENNVFLEKANHNNMYANKLRRSYYLAYTAISMTILERLKRYSFLTRYNLKAQLDTNENSNAVTTINNHENADEEIFKAILYNNNETLSAVSLTNIIDFNEIIPSSQPELDTTIKLKKRKIQI